MKKTVKTAEINSKDLIAYDYEDIKDEILGAKGTSTRDTFERKLAIEIEGEKIKELRKARNLTQEDN